MCVCACVYGFVGGWRDAPSTGICAEDGRERTQLFCKGINEGFIKGKGRITQVLVHVRMRGYSA